MSPIRSFLCHHCMYDFDEIVPMDHGKIMDCPRCDERGAARQIPTAPSTPRGNFGTATRRANDKPQKLKFVPEKKE